MVSMEQEDATNVLDPQPWFTVLISGTRTATQKDVDYVQTILDLLLIACPEDHQLRIVVGDAQGIDKIAYYWAKQRGVPCQVFYANWQKYGKSGGIIRNLRMFDEGKPDYVLAFPAPSSKGTVHAMNEAKKRNIKMEFFTIDDPEEQNASTKHPSNA